MWETPLPNFNMCTREASHLRLAILLANLVQHAFTVIFYVLRSNRTATLSIIEATKENRCSSRPTCKCSAERHRRRAWQRCPAEPKLMIIFNKLIALKGQQFRGSAHLAPCTNQGLAAATLGELGCQIHVGWTFLSRQQKKKTTPSDELLPVCKGSAKLPTTPSRSNCFLQTHTDGCSTQSLRDANLPSSKNQLVPPKLLSICNTNCTTSLGCPTHSITSSAVHKRGRASVCNDAALTDLAREMEVVGQCCERKHTSGSGASRVPISACSLVMRALIVASTVHCRPLKQEPRTQHLPSFPGRPSNSWCTSRSSRSSQVCSCVGASSPM